MKPVIMLLIIFLFNNHLFSQSIKKNISDSYLNFNTEFHLLASKEIQDTFHIFINYPQNYSPDKKYPVLYLLDGDLTFPIAKGVVQYLLYGQHIPEMIVVGIGYGSLDWQTGNQRSRDYTPTQRPDRLYEGGAEKFYSFLQKDLIPFINKKFSTDRNTSILFGHSLGGLFTSYSLLQKEKLFSHYLLSSPHLWHNEKAIFSFENDYRKDNNSLNAKVFVSYGEKELQDVYIDTINDFVKNVTEKNYSGLKLTKYVIRNGEHFTSPAFAMAYGLKTLFSQ